MVRLIDWLLPSEAALAIILPPDFANYFAKLVRVFVNFHIFPKEIEQGGKKLVDSI